MLVLWVNLVGNSAPHYHLLTHSPSVGWGKGKKAWTEMKTVEWIIIIISIIILIKKLHVQAKEFLFFSLADKCLAISRTAGLITYYSYLGGQTR